MSNRRITVTIDQLGRPKIEAEGFAGGSCVAATAPIEQALSSGEVTRDVKPSFYEEETQQEQVTQSW